MQYKYCPKCAGALQKEFHNLFICQNCGFHFYQNPRPTNGVILINDKDEILLVKRNRPPKKGWWDLPGGFIDLNETLEESMLRELKEELKIAPKNMKLLGSYNGNYLYDEINYQTLCFVFIAKIDKLPYYSKEEFEELRFFAKDKLPLNKLAFVELRKAFKDFLKVLSSS